MVGYGTLPAVSAPSPRARRRSNARTKPRRRTVLALARLNRSYRGGRGGTRRTATASTRRPRRCGGSRRTAKAFGTGTATPT